MPFEYHPPTRDYCKVCVELEQTKSRAIIETHNGKASSAGKFPVHNWYYFVLGYSPEFPEYILTREKANKEYLVVDPFMGTGTTLVTCKSKGIPSAGIDANDFFFDAANTKLNWSINTMEIKKERDNLLSKIIVQYDEFDFGSINNPDHQLPLFNIPSIYKVEEYANFHRMKMLDKRYISDKPFTRWYIIKELINQEIKDENTRKLFNLAIASILIPASNVRYGPGFGVIKPKDDVDVLRLFRDKINLMIADLESVSDTSKLTPSRVIKGDTREISKYFEPDSVDLMITSPPYPGDHEYTKHTRLELIAMGYAQNVEEFRTIKKRMLRGSTTNIYHEDDDKKHIKDIQSIQKITSLINERLIHDGATSGFEKLYTKLVWEYFGGMYLALKEIHKILKPNGKISLLVSDSHAFKMVHIQTAEILAEIGKFIGYSKIDIELWQDKVSTSHKYNLRENTLTLTK